MEIRVCAVSIATALRREGSVAAVDGADVRQIEVHALVVRLQREEILELLLTAGTLLGRVGVGSHVGEVDDVTGAAALKRVVVMLLRRLLPCDVPLGLQEGYWIYVDPGVAH